MEITYVLYLLLIGIGAGFVQRVSGFGLGIFAMLFLPHFMPTHTAASAISTLITCGITGYNAIKYKNHIPYKTTLPLACAALITIPIAVYFSVRIPAEIFKAILGVVLICLSIYFLFFTNRVKVKPTIRNGLLAGGIGGTLTGLFSTGGPPVVLYLTHATNSNTAYFAGIQFYFCLTSIYATIIRIINKIFTPELFVYALIGFVGCLIGNALGTLVFDRLDGKKLKKIIYIGMIISGVLMIL